MSNESENERIDLTQFEGLTTPWDFHAKYLHIESAKVAVKLIAELKRCYEELDRPKVTIDDWDKAGPCVTVYLEGKEYVGILREYDASE